MHNITLLISTLASEYIYINLCLWWLVSTQHNSILELNSSANISLSTTLMCAFVYCFFSPNIVLFFRALQKNSKVWWIAFWMVLGTTYCTTNRQHFGLFWNTYCIVEEHFGQYLLFDNFLDSTILMINCIAKH